MIALWISARLVGMYLRTTQRRNRDGTVVRYVQLAHNRRVDGVTQAQVLLNLGREDQLDRDGLRRLVSSINRYLGEADAGLPADATPLVGDGLRVTGSRPVGTVHLLDGLWRALDVDAALRKVLGSRRFTTNVERVLFALVANRAIDPMSKLSAAEWATCDVAIDGLEAMDEDQAYRAMDLLVEADAQAEVQEAVFFAVADLLNLEVDLLLFDTTSTYFERDTEEDGDEAFRRYGHSKDHRDDLPQVVIGLAVTKEGIPVRVWCWPGNTNDQAILPEVKDDIRSWRLGRIITVVDRGFSSADNLAYLRRGGGHFIAGMRMRDGNPLTSQVLSRQGRYQQVRDNLRVKEIAVEGTDVRFIICHNPEQAERDRTRREDAITRLEAELERIKQARERDRTKNANNKAKQQAEAAHLKAECALRDHRSLGRWLRQSPSGRLLIDRAKIKAEARLDGKYLLATSDPHISAEDTALGYKNLLEAERGFRDMKSALLLRPVFHRLEHRIRAHVLLCWLALLLVRVAERRTGTTWRRIATDLGRVHAVSLTGSVGTAVHTTPLTTAQADVFRQCQVVPPATITALDPG
ncbi:IS1634 family transposase [Rhodococcus wratislaviensis]|uniref:IS1634 family transposase n=1 Tax=Rhodococcus wratislaviensis TaxID=44752 RepID=UPI001CEDCD2C|nr:IS1634 family transposase [Rhodococcus wratislaviensis]